MARLPYLDKSDLAPEHGELLARDINLMRLLVHSPGLARCELATALYIRNDSPLDPRLRELAILQVGYSLRSAYEFSQHVKIGRDFGVTDDDIRAIADESADRPTDLEPLAKAVLQTAREIALDNDLTDATFALLRAELDDECVVDLIATITVYIGTAHLLAAFRIDIDEDYRGYLEAFPFPEATPRDQPT